MIDRKTISDTQMLLMERPTTSHRKKMSIENRAAQFAPFAALTGHKETVQESNRVTKRKIILDENQREQLDYQLQILKANLNKKVFITYFVEDDTKTGGKYVVESKGIKRIDEYTRTIVFEDNISIKIDNIIEIESQE